MQNLSTILFIKMSATLTCFQNMKKMYIASIYLKSKRKILILSL